MNDVKFKFTNVFKRLIKNLDKDLHIFYGGSSSSKTISILQYLTLYALQNKNKRITISSESLPVIRKTLFPDWRDHIMKDFFDSNSFNKSDNLYTFYNNSIFQFIPADDESRWHGLRSDIVYFDELYYINKNIFEQAEIRTREKVFASFNPHSPFWIQDRFHEKNTYVDHSTYKDNQFLDNKIIEKLENKIKNKNFYDVYVLGKFGNLEGLIFEENKEWFITNEWPTEYKKRIYGLDFGFSIDPTALVEILYTDGNIYIRELLYERGLLNNEIAKYIDYQTIADSAEPKSIEEIRRLGKDIRSASKGEDSIRNGIKLIKEFNIYVHVDSLNIIKEFRNYSYMKNRQGDSLNKPEDTDNHAIDALRYGLTYMMNEKKIFFGTF